MYLQLLSLTLDYFSSTSVTVLHLISYIQGVIPVARNSTIFFQIFLLVACNDKLFSQMQHTLIILLTTVSNKEYI